MMFERADLHRSSAELQTMRLRAVAVTEPSRPAGGDKSARVARMRARLRLSGVDVAKEERSRFKREMARLFRLAIAKATP